jgi:hypothetical protein
VRVAWWAVAMARAMVRPRPVPTGWVRGAVEAVKAVEDRLQLVGWEAGPGVGDPEHGVASAESARSLMGVVSRRTANAAIRAPVSSETGAVKHVAGLMRK